MSNDSDQLSRCSENLSDIECQKVLENGQSTVPVSINNVTRHLESPDSKPLNADQSSNIVSEIKSPEQCKTPTDT